LFLGLVIAGTVMRHTRRTEDALQQQKEQAEVTLHSVADAVITTDAAGGVAYLNPVAAQLTGWRDDAARGRPLPEVYRVLRESNRTAAAHPAFRGGLDGPTVGLERHWLLVARDGSEYAVEDSVAPIRDRDDRITGQVLIFRDVTRARELARQLSWQAHHDTLTGLPNRHSFELTLRRLLDSARTEHRQHALLYVDLDQFKVVNDTCGHAAGDELLRQLALIFQAQIRHSDLLARLGGDEFGVLLESCSLEQARRIADQLRAATEDFRFVHADKVFRVLASIGLVHIDRHSDEPPRLLSAADAACYMAKEKGRNRVWVHQADDAELRQRHGEMRQTARVAHALEENRFVLYGQNIRPLKPGAGRPPMCEVLMRLLDEEGRVQTPMAVIPAAERYGLMSAIDRWVIRHALDALAGAQIAAAEAISLNVSSQSLGDDHFLGFVLEQLQATAIDPRRCMFEITETTAIANWGRALHFVSTLKGLGCRFALDDFGAGMSSFAYLQSLPVDMVKIDGRFVRQIAHNPTDRAMVEAIHHVAHVMGIATVAESVEDARALAVVQQLGIDYAQGYAIHRPAPLLDLDHRRSAPA
jgi:diguanylate cyclase (GGDEF)-like protein/PAS domain S-box-containing protein